jgi:serine/threonine protein kinase
MGVVYKAKQTGLKRLVALKMILSAGRASKIEIARFRIEAEAVAKLDHPNIVKIYEIGEIDNLPFFSLEFVSGGVLSSRIKNNIPTARQAATMMRGIAEGMDFAHRKGIVHRDLKPANILLSPPDQAGEDVDFETIPLDLFVPKITDFGLAKTLEGDSIQTRDGAIMGTPSYMAPEQALGKTAEIGPAADIYGLGAILYDIITGIPPFRGETVMDTITQVIHKEPVHPVRLNAKLPADIGTICLKCLEKDPKKRYATAGALAEDLRRYLVGEPILARPTPFYEYAWKWAKRKPAISALILMTFFMVLGVSVGGYILAGREKIRADENLRLKEEAVAERNIAEQQKLQAERNFRDALAAVDQMLTKAVSYTHLTLPTSP